MKKILLALTLFSLTASAAVKVKRIDPTNWFVDMKDPSLQLMVYGEGIRNANVSTTYPGVEITSIERMDSPNYLLVYLNIGKAKAGKVPLVFAQGKQKTTVTYELKARDKKGEERMGFTNADVLYMFMPDRFAASGTKQHPLPGLNAYRVDRSQPSLRHGGDLEGIRQHLDYFNQLGVTALWFTPVLENNAADKGNYNMYHGYGTTDYYKVDPRFGTNAEYRRLVDESHTKGLKVVMDMIFNHCGVDHPWVKDMPSHNWFNRPDYKNNYLQTSYKLTPVLDPYASEVDMDETVDGWFVPEYPDLNQRNPHVMRYLIQNSIWWIETVGIDGIRMDTYPYADREAMAQWMDRLNREYPNFNTVGETWVTEPAYTAAWQKDSKLSNINSNLKSVMDFAFFDRINKAKNEETDDWWNGLNRVYNDLCYDYLYPNPSSVMAFIENHDTDPGYFFCFAKVRDPRSHLSETNDYDRIFQLKGIFIDIFPYEKMPLPLLWISNRTFGRVYKVMNNPNYTPEQLIAKVRRIRKVNERFVFPVLRAIAKLWPTKFLNYSPGIPYDNTILPEETFPLTTAEFDGLTVPVPADTDAYLRRKFGNYMQLPSLDNLHPHSAKLTIDD